MPVMIDAPRSVRLAQRHVGDPAPVAARRRGWLAQNGCLATADGTAQFRSRAVRQCLDVAAVLRRYREPLPGETWRTPASAERRLLAQLDALLALGKAALCQAVALAFDGDVAEPDRVFAATLLLGCTAERAWLNILCERAALACSRSPPEAAAAVEGLSLAPRGDLGAALAPWLGEADPRLRASAVRVLGFRGELAERDWQRALQDADAGVVLAAARAPLHAYDARACESALLPLLGRASESLTRAVLRAGATLRSPALHAQARRCTQADGAWAQACLSMAMHGDLGDVALLRSVLHSPNWRDGVAAAACLGAAALVPDLLALQGAAEQAAMAQERASIVAALAAIGGESFAVAAHAADAGCRWRAIAHRFDASRRWRAGAPLDAATLLRQLACDSGTRDERARLCVELRAMCAQRLPRFSPHAFVATQEADLRRIAQLLEGSRKVVVEATP